MAALFRCHSAGPANFLAPTQLGEQNMNWRELVSHFKTSSFGRSELEGQIEDELRDHIERETIKNIEAGLSPDEARRRALLDFGGVAQVKEDVRDTSRFMWLETALQDIRFALRMLRNRRALRRTAQAVQ
jgi:hypothetical protein